MTSDDFIGELRSLPGENSSPLPHVLSTTAASKYPFGSLSMLHYFLWKELQRQTSMEFDLLYAPRAFEILLSQTQAVQECGRSFFKKQPSVSTMDNIQEFVSKLSLNWEPASNLLYYHCGGVEGNPSLKRRFAKFGIDR
jgi:1-aminocyclopropane-1-carboxylate deaminase/D-cysteine desulfhydrase-like pyridoxal-dependent ACC family enzyme